MKKTVINSQEIGKFLFGDTSAAIEHYVDCPVKSCGGKILITPLHSSKNAATICPKCFKAIIPFEIKC